MREAAEAYADTEEIDIEKIMEEIRADIAERGLTDDLPEFSSVAVFGSFESPSYPEGSLEAEQSGDQWESIARNALSLEESIIRLDMTREVPAYHPIGSRGGIAGRVFSLFKKVIRRCVHFHTTPIVTDQNRCNEQALQTIIQLRDIIYKQNEQLKRQSERFIKLCEQLSIYQDEFTELGDKVIHLEQELARLKKRYDTTHAQ